MKTRNTIDKMDLSRLLDEYAPGCECNWPEWGESGVIHSLACKVRDTFGIPPTKEHKENSRLIPEDDL